MAIQITCTERDIEDLIQENCRHYLSSRFIKRQVKTPVGIIDIISRSFVNRGLFYVVELKNGPIDADAYVQVVRYASWLNSECSKNGRRLFVPVLVGNGLREDVHRICDYFEPMQHDWYELFGRVFYRLFNFDPLTGISFNWHSNYQKAHQASKKQNFHHAGNLSKRYDQMRYCYETIALESRRYDVGADRPFLSLVKDGDAA